MSYPCPYQSCIENHLGECMADGCRRVPPPSWERDGATDWDDVSEYARELDVSNGESHN